MKRLVSASIVVLVFALAITAQTSGIRSFKSKSKESDRRVFHPTQKESSIPCLKQSQPQTRVNS